MLGIMGGKSRKDIEDEQSDSATGEAGDRVDEGDGSGSAFVYDGASEWQDSADCSEGASG
jgi:hypothetical protein